MSQACRVPIFYDPRQSLDAFATDWPPANLPRRFVEAARGLYSEVDIQPVAPAHREDLYLVHDFDYVDGVLAGTRNNGYENVDFRVTEACLWGVGGMIAAALYAPKTPYPVCVPVSGFRHAGFKKGGAFSTFNGIAVAAAKFLAEHPNSIIGILDCCNGVSLGIEDILMQKPDLAKQVRYHSAAQSLQGMEVSEEQFFEWLQVTVENLNDARCDLVLYQAGSDMCSAVHTGGSVGLTGMMLREWRVFKGIRAPLVWSLAEGPTNRNRADHYVSLVHAVGLARANDTRRLERQTF